MFLMSILEGSAVAASLPVLILHVKAMDNVMRVVCFGRPCESGGPCMQSAC